MSFTEDDLDAIDKYSEGGTPAPTSFQLSPTLRFTTTHTPKDPSAGFVFGSNEEKCDILLATSRETGISGTQFAVTFHQQSTAVIIKNLSTRGTKIRSQSEGATRLRTQRTLHEMEVTTIYLPGLELNVSKLWRHGDTIAPEYRAFLARVASSTPELGLLRLQSSATTGTGIIHRDVKPSNILMIERQPLHIKLAGFGVSTRDEKPTNCCGTDKYRAPDVSNPPYTNKIDIWSVGAVGVELWIGLPEYDPSLWPNLVSLVAGNKALSSQERSFFCQLLHPNSDVRPTAQECLSLNFAAHQRKGSKSLCQPGPTSTNGSIPSTAVWDPREPSRSPIIADNQNQTSHSMSAHDIQKWAQVTAIAARRHQPESQLHAPAPAPPDWQDNDMAGPADAGFIYPTDFDLHFDFDSQGVALGHADRLSKWQAHINPERKKLNPEASSNQKEKPPSYRSFDCFL
ncbi:hypothetical protein F66182_10560 [Fusarium sp. NRRL 66182]|nr:hypothetical protein F66182_10560 [Fusarium sp. NRRL 66182]